MKKSILGVFLAFFLISLPLISANVGNGCGMSGMYGMMGGSYGYGGMFFGWVFTILVIVALILLIVWLIKQIQKK